MGLNTLIPYYQNRNRYRYRYRDRNRSPRPGFDIDHDLDDNGPGSRSAGCFSHLPNLHDLRGYMNLEP